MILQAFLRTIGTYGFLRYCNDYRSSVVSGVHEMAHGYAANWLGDPTARLQGRLSANPLVHIDPLMSVILPGL